LAKENGGREAQRAFSQLCQPRVFRGALRGLAYLSEFFLFLGQQLEYHPALRFVGEYIE
jgi:hypothetical protein